MTNTTNNKSVAVFGSTGQQGGAVVRALLKDGFKVRAFTRNTESDNAKKLKELNGEIEVVQCDESQPKEIIEKALQGVDKVFLVTNTFGYGEKEIEYGIKVADASLSAGINHLVFSSLPSAKLISSGKNPVPDLDNKAEIEVHIRQLSKLNPSFISSFLYAPSYYQNFVNYFPPTPTDKVNEKGEKIYEISMPNDPSPTVPPMEYGDISDIGSIVSHLFLDPVKFSNATIEFTSERLSPTQIIDIYKKVTGKSVVYNYIPPSVFETLGFPGCKEIANLYALFNDFETSSPNIITHNAHSFVKLTTFEQFLNKINFKLD